MGLKKCTRMNVIGVVDRGAPTENVEKLCQEGHEGYGYKGGNGTGPLCIGEILLGVRPVLARMPEHTVCVLGSRTLNEYDDDDDESFYF